MSLSLLLLSCSTYRYAVTYTSKPLAIEQPTATVNIGFQPDSSGIGLGVLTVSNQGPDRVYLVWNDLSTVQNGIQKKVYKGEITNIMKEMSVPDQPIDAGATIAQTIVTERAYVVDAKRPATPVDYALCWVYGLGCLIANTTWKPEADDFDKYLPGWREHDYNLIVSLRLGDHTETATLVVDAASVKAVRIKNQ